MCYVVSLPHACLPDAPPARILLTVPFLSLFSCLLTLMLQCTTFQSLPFRSRSKLDLPSIPLCFPSPSYTLLERLAESNASPCTQAPQATASIRRTRATRSSGCSMVCNPQMSTSSEWAGLVVIPALEGSTFLIFESFYIKVKPFRTRRVSSTNCTHMMNSGPARQITRIRSSC